jgi:putative oxidoreductase
MCIIFPIARIMSSFIFIPAAPRHFSGEGVAHPANLGVPFARLLVPLSGVMAIVGGLSIAFGYKARWGAWVLVAFLLPVTWMMHAYWKRE